MCRVPEPAVFILSMSVMVYLIQRESEEHKAPDWCCDQRSSAENHIQTF